MDAKDFLVVVREAGERTANVCCDILRAAFPGIEMHRICEIPFEAALNRTLQIGRDSSRTWTLTVDADCLIRAAQIDELFTVARSVKPNCFQVQGRILCKLSCDARFGGPRVYRNELMSEALNLAPSKGYEARPEAQTLDMMKKAGYGYQTVPILTAIHDFEQYYGDLYRKAFLHGKKHIRWLPTVLPTWKEQASDDADFRVALRGIWDGMMCDEPISLDASALKDRVDAILNDCGLDEKPSLEGDALTPAAIEELVLSHGGKEVEWLLRAEAGILKRGVMRGREIGWLRLFPYTLGWSMERVGRSIQSVSARHRL